MQSRARVCGFSEGDTSRRLLPPSAHQPCAHMAILVYEGVHGDSDVWVAGSGIFPPPRRLSEVSRAGSLMGAVRRDIIKRLH